MASNSDSGNKGSSLIARSPFGRCFDKLFNPCKTSEAQVRNSVTQEVLQQEQRRKQAELYEEEQQRRSRKQSSSTTHKEGKNAGNKPLQPSPTEESEAPPDKLECRGILVEDASDSEIEEDQNEKDPFVPGPGEAWMEPV
jgi:hypothetical protein